ncbi:MAG: mobile mystery protein B [Desulfobulbaceae bacterium]|jgi:Fic-DOC domain mobile mystery protein B|nr:mobile mystery protein B [Desulfobulbaceae bacterium]
MDDQYQDPDGATPLDPDEIEGLRLDHIQTREELNQWEHENIQKALLWTLGRNDRNLLSQGFICTLHQKMFEDVWRWAGQFRKTEKNIGCDPAYIATNVAQLCEDCQGWIEYKSYPADEIAARFHHRLVSIHPFPNGNGRHARLLTDLLLQEILNEPVFTWGNADLDNPSEGRGEYIGALKEADNGNITPLLGFVRKK